MADDAASGWLESFLVSISYADRLAAERAHERLTQIVREQFKGQLPDRFKTKIRKQHRRPL